MVLEARDISPEVSGRREQKYFICGLDSTSSELDKMARVEDPDKIFPRVSGYVLEGERVVFTRGDHRDLEFSGVVEPGYKNVLAVLSVAKKFSDPTTSAITIISPWQDIIEQTLGFLSRSLSTDTRADVVVAKMPLIEN